MTNSQTSPTEGFQPESGSADTITSQGSSEASTVKFGFPTVIDSTILSDFTNCPLSAYRKYCLKLASPYKSIHLHAGGAFAKAIEIVRKARWLEGKSFNDSIEDGYIAFVNAWGNFEAPEVGSGANKTFERVWGAVESYFDEYPMDTDPIRPYMLSNMEPGIEFSFGIPLDGINHPDTGDPMIFGGRLDLLGYYRDLPAIIDEKTASQLGDSWAKQWKMRGQFFGYVWAVRHHDVRVKCAIIRGVSILKTKYGHLEVIEQNFSDFMLNRWEANMRRKLQMFIGMYQHARSIEDHDGLVSFPMAFGDACNAYGGCMFKDLCVSKKPSVWYNNYSRRDWNPLVITEGS